MEIWAIANQKGGVGKTTTAVSLGGCLAASGKKVLLLDIDPQGSLTLYFHYDPDELKGSLYNVFEASQKSLSTGNNQCPLTQNECLPLILETSAERLFLFPSSALLATVERQNYNSSKSNPKPNASPSPSSQSKGNQGLGLVLKHLLAELDGTFDYVLIDSPPQLGILMINALACCTRLIIPVQTEFLALKGLERMLRSVEMVIHALQTSDKQDSAERNADIVIMPTMFDRRTQASVQCLRHLRNHYADIIWPAMIPVDTQFRNASKAGVTPSEYRPTSHGIEAYQRFLNYLQHTSLGQSQSMGSAHAN